MLILTNKKNSNTYNADPSDSICYYFFNGNRLKGEHFERCLLSFPNVALRHNVLTYNYYPFDGVDCDKVIEAMLSDAAEQTFSTVFVFDNSKYTQRFLECKELLKESGVELVVVPFDKRKCKGLFGKRTLKRLCG